jgi:hypothetical protein
VFSSISENRAVVAGPAIGLALDGGCYRIVSDETARLCRSDELRRY